MNTPTTHPPAAGPNSDTALRRSGGTCESLYDDWKESF